MRLPLYSTSTPRRTIAAACDSDKDLAGAESQSPQSDSPSWTARVWNTLLPENSGRDDGDERTCPGPRRRTSKLNSIASLFPVDSWDVLASGSSCPLVEDYPVGRPRFAALIASHESFSFCRRFSYLRARLLLEKQDHLSLLEKQLGDIDSEESNRLHLSSSRLDGNEKRKQVTKEIDNALVDYGILHVLIFSSYVPAG